ncbi:VacJ family lipoprotein [Chitinibacter sp. S2-10]|uniref:MlaA family lipoprotein n=1 Tax=Chitinibacter sp. S2-10 TaxID=3373597 RepID=UPI0039776E80
MRRLILLSAVLLTACATPQNNYDPLEAVNRPIYSFNSTLDEHLLRPVAQAYTDYIPSPLRTAVYNFAGNLDDLFGIPAALLQAKGVAASKSTARVIVNSTVGLGGLIDWASDLPIEKQDEDFGQMFGAWGIPSGPYLMIPFYGPLTVRDSTEKLARLAWGPIDYIDPLGGQIAYYGVMLTDVRAQLLPFDATIREQLDPYAFVRDTYLQRRWYKVYDGNPPYPLPMGDSQDDAANPDRAAEFDTPVAEPPQVEAGATETLSTEVQQ